MPEADEETGKHRQPVSVAPSQGMFASLALPRFRTLWTGMLFSSAAMQFNLISRPWLAFQLTGSGLDLGIVAAARALPQLVLAPLGGVVADRFDKRSVLMTSQSLLAVLSLANAILVHTGVVEIWHLIVVGLLQGLVFPFTIPARQAFVPELVGPRYMVNALALDSAGRNLNRIATPAIAGVLLAWSPTLAFYAIALFYLFSTITIFRLPPGPPVERESGWSFDQLTVGFRYIYKSSLLKNLVGMGFVVVALGMPFQQLLTVFQTDVFEVSPRGLGLMFTMVGLGGLTGSLAVAYLANSPRKGLLQIAMGVIFGIGLALFALTNVFWIALIFLFITGLASQGYLTLNRVMVVMNTEPHLYGRVMSIYSMTWAMAPLALLPMGIMVDVVGPKAVVSTAGLILAGSVILISLLNPKLWRGDSVAASHT